MVCTHYLGIVYFIIEFGHIVINFRFYFKIILNYFSCGMILYKICITERFLEYFICYYLLDVLHIFVEFYGFFLTTSSLCNLLLLLLYKYTKTIKMLLLFIYILS